MNTSRHSQAEQSITQHLSGVSTGAPASQNVSELQRAAGRAGVRLDNNAKELDLGSIDRRRTQLWMLTAGVSIVVIIDLLMIGSELGASLPIWIPSQMLKTALFVVFILLGIYTLEKEYQLRKVPRLLLDEQFERDVLTRRLKVVDTLLETSKAINSNMDPEQILRTIARQASYFLEENDLSVFFVQRGGGILQLNGLENEAHSKAAISVIESKQSRCIHS